MTIRDMIAEWRKGCSIATALNPEDCPECTTGLITAIEDRLQIDEDRFARLYGVARAAYEGWRTGDNVAGPMHRLRDFLDAIRDYAPLPDVKIGEVKVDLVVDLADLPLGQEVVDLVIAARHVVYGDINNLALAHGDSDHLERLGALDKATEKFAEIVPWDDEPEDEIDLSDNPARVLRKMAEQADFPLTDGQRLALDLWETYCEQPVGGPVRGEYVDDDTGMIKTTTLEFPNVTSRDQAERLADAIRNPERHHPIASSITDFQVGTVIRHRHSADAMVVVGNYGDYAIAVRQQHIANPSEWLLICAPDV